MRNYFFNLDETWFETCLVTLRIFFPLEMLKNSDVVWWCKRNCFFPEKFFKFILHPTHGQSVEQGHLDQHQIWHRDAWHVWSCKWGEGFKIYQLFSGASQRTTKSKMVKTPFRVLFWPSWATIKFNHQ